MNYTDKSASGAGTSAGVTVSVVAILFIPALIFSIVGNLLVVHSVCFKPRFSRPANFMLANLSLNSLLQALSMLSGLLHKKYPMFSYGPWTCPIFPIIHNFVIPAEGFTVMCISLERARVIMQPLERESSKRALKKIATIWISSLLIELPHGLFWTYTEDTPSYLKCINAKELFASKTPYIVYAWSYFLVVIILPISFMLGESALLARRLKFLISVQDEWSQYQVCSYKLIRNALIFIVIFICLKFPPSLVHLITRMPSGVFSQSVAEWASTWKSTLFRVGALNGSLYPLIIFALSNKIRELLCCYNARVLSPPQALSIYHTSRRHWLKAAEDV